MSSKSPELWLRIWLEKYIILLKNTYITVSGESYDVITPRFDSIWINFGTPMKNKMSTTMSRSVSKPEVELQCGGHLFSETGSSNNSAVDWDMSSKFGTEIDFDLLRRLPSLNLTFSFLPLFPFPTFLQLQLKGMAERLGLPGQLTCAAIVLRCPLANVSDTFHSFTGALGTSQLSWKLHIAAFIGAELGKNIEGARLCPPGVDPESTAGGEGSGGMGVWGTQGVEGSGRGREWPWLWLYHSISLGMTMGLGASWTRSRKRISVLSKRHIMLLVESLS